MADMNPLDIFDAAVSHGPNCPNDCRVAVMYFIREPSNLQVRDMPHQIINPMYANQRPMYSAPQFAHFNNFLGTVARILNGQLLIPWDITRPIFQTALSTFVQAHTNNGAFLVRPQLVTRNDTLHVPHPSQAGVDAIYPSIVSSNSYQAGFNVLHPPNVSNISHAGVNVTNPQNVSVNSYHAGLNVTDLAIVRNYSSQAGRNVTRQPIVSNNSSQAGPNVTYPPNVMNNSSQAGPNVMHPSIESDYSTGARPPSTNTRQNDLCRRLQVFQIFNLAKAEVGMDDNTLADLCARREYGVGLEVDEATCESIVVADTLNCQVRRFSTDGQPWPNVAICSQAQYPRFVALYKGDCVVLDQLDSSDKTFGWHLHLHKSNGLFLKNYFGQPMSFKGRVRCITIDPLGRLIVVQNDQKITVFCGDLSNAVYSVFRAGCVSEAKSVCTDDQMQLYISDFALHNICIFSYTTGKYLRTVGGPGITDYPITIAVDSNRQLVVVSTENYGLIITMLDQEGVPVDVYKIDYFTRRHRTMNYAINRSGLLAVSFCTDRKEFNIALCRPC